MPKTSIIFYGKTETVSKLKFWIYYVGVMVPHSNFFEDDLRTHESPHGPLLGAQALKYTLEIVTIWN